MGCDALGGGGGAIGGIAGGLGGGASIVLQVPSGNGKQPAESMDVEQLDLLAALECADALDGEVLRSMMERDQVISERLQSEELCALIEEPSPEQVAEQEAQVALQVSSQLYLCKTIKHGSNNKNRNDN